MNIKRLKTTVNKISEEGEWHKTFYFKDQDGDYYTVNDVEMDSDGDICLTCKSDGSDDYNVSELAFWLGNWDNSYHVYLYDEDQDLTFDIKGGWYKDDEDDVVMDVKY